MNSTTGTETRYCVIETCFSVLTERCTCGTSRGARAESGEKEARCPVRMGNYFSRSGSTRSFLYINKTNSALSKTTSVVLSCVILATDNGRVPVKTGITKSRYVGIWW